MADQIQSRMQCAEFETLLFEAIDGTGKDGTLVAGALASFQTHAAGCASCGPLLADVKAGRDYMLSLAEIEPPKNLIHNILARTSGVAERFAEAAPAQQPRWSLNWLRPVLTGTWATVRQPRFGMSVAMAFFSVSLVMSVAGIKVNDVAKLDLRPSAIKRSYYSTQARVVKYYSNMRGFYEFESMLHNIQRATTPAEGAPVKQEQPKQPRKDKDNDKTSGRPNKGQGSKGGDRNQDENYAQQDSQSLVAQADNCEFWNSTARREA